LEQRDSPPEFDGCAGSEDALWQRRIEFNYWSNPSPNTANTFGWKLRPTNDGMELVKTRRRGLQGRRSAWRRNGVRVNSNNLGIRLRRSPRNKKW